MITFKEGMAAGGFTISMALKDDHAVRHTRTTELASIDYANLEGLHYIPFDRFQGITKGPVFSTFHTKCALYLVVALLSTFVRGQQSPDKEYPSRITYSISSESLGKDITAQVGFIPEYIKLPSAFLHG